MNDFHHDPVMIEAVLATLDLRPGGTVVDGTLGLAGHARRMAEAVGPEGELFAFDWDETMLREAEVRLEGVPLRRKTLVNRDFRAIPETLDAASARANGVLLDLGLSSR